jgi:ribosomal protein L37AE/L43A
MNTAQALREVFGVTISGVEHTCPSCYSQKVARNPDGSWKCSNCPWSGPEQDTIGGNQTPAAQVPDAVTAWDEDAQDTFDNYVAKQKAMRIEFKFDAQPSAGTDLLGYLEAMPAHMKPTKTKLTKGWVVRAVPYYERYRAPFDIFAPTGNWVDCASSDVLEGHIVETGAKLMMLKPGIRLFISIKPI